MEIDKFGIKGDSGLTGDENGAIHISANYSSNSMVYRGKECHYIKLEINVGK